MSTSSTSAEPNTDGQVTRLPPKHYGFYNRLRRKVARWLDSKAGREHKWSAYILLVPDMFHLLCRLSVDPEVPLKWKAKVGLAIAYFISPLDFLPEALLGPAGYMDDLGLAAYVLNSMVNEVNSEVLRKHWAGDGDVLEQIRGVLASADDMIGSGLWARILKKFAGSSEKPTSPKPE